jgi:hypothetical protein
VGALSHVTTGEEVMAISSQKRPLRESENSNELDVPRRWRQFGGASLNAE